MSAEGVEEAPVTKECAGCKVTFLKDDYSKAQFRKVESLCKACVDKKQAAREAAAAETEDGEPRKKSFKCNGCGEEVTSSRFTSAEWRKGEEERQCKTCVPPQPKEKGPAQAKKNAAEGDGEERTVKKLYTCNGCGASKTSSQFKSSEWKKGEAERKCKTCVPPIPRESRAAATKSDEPKPLHLCQGCDGTSKSSHFTSAEWRKGVEARRCKDCKPPAGYVSATGATSTRQSSERPARKRKDQQGEFECQPCERSFATAQGLSRHNQAKHGEAPPARASSGKGEDKPKDDRPLPLCKGCDERVAPRRFSSPEWKKGEEDRRCKACCGEPAPKPRRQQPASDEPPKLHECKGCGSSVKSSRFLSSEWRKGEEERRCKDCTTAA